MLTRFKKTDGHDFWILGQGTGTYDTSTVSLNMVNPPRRDVVQLPGNGFVVIAFKTDNPGVSLFFPTSPMVETLANNYVTRSGLYTVTLHGISQKVSPSRSWSASPRSPPLLTRICSTRRVPPGTLTCRKTISSRLTRVYERCSSTHAHTTPN